VTAPALPAAVAVAVPVLPPLQVTLVPATVADKVQPGCPTVLAHVAVQLFASVTVTVYVPAINPVIVAVVAALLHR
jgi:hypothetical protein